MSSTLPVPCSGFVTRVCRGTLLGLLVSVVVARAGSLEADEAMQETAPEALVIQVISVNTTPGKDGVQVEARAKVVIVGRTKTNLKAGDVFALSYAAARTPPLPPGSGGPASAAVEAYADYAAYLEGGPPPFTYRPAAEGQSLTLLSKAKMFVPANSPIQPSDELKQAELIRENNRWYVKLKGTSSKLPLMATSETPPMLLGSALLGEIIFAKQLQKLGPAKDGSVPATVKSLAFWNSPTEFGPEMLLSFLVYQAGSTTAPDDPNTVLQVERALIYDPANSRPIGDALWAVRGPNGTQGLPQPVWHVSLTTLTVENPYEKTIQQISLPLAADKK